MQGNYPVIQMHCLPGFSMHAFEIYSTMYLKFIVPKMCDKIYITFICLEIL
jgi:hypothetical protein